ncbi:MAG: hypothetical protein ACPIGG_05530 [Akkermansiaceae bacterium]
MITSKNKNTVTAMIRGGMLGIMLISQSLGDILQTDRGDIFSGTTQSFHDEVLEFATPLSPNPFKVRTSSVYKIDFTTKKQESTIHGEVLTLINGDRVPCNVLSMDENKLQISTTYAGEISLKRESIRSLRFGLMKGKLLFAGGQDPQQWTAQSGTWSLNEDAHYVGKGSLAQKLSLPDKARFQFHLSWEKAPNFAFRFYADDSAARQKQSTYELVINSEGMVINRYPDSRHQATPIANLSSQEIKALEQPNQSVHIDLHVGKSDGLILLYVNSEFMGKWQDPYGPAGGNHIIFDNRSDKPANAVVGQISVSSITGEIGDKFFDPDLVAKDTDILADNQGQVFSGRLLTIQPIDSAKRLVTISHELTDQPEPIPDHNVSTLLFGSHAGKKDSPHSKYLLTLSEGGKLQVNEPSMSAEAMVVEHPILGSIRLLRNHVQSITNKGKQPPTK